MGEGRVRIIEPVFLIGSRIDLRRLQPNCAHRRQSTAG
jgi:hypothetical protein